MLKEKDLPKSKELMQKGIDIIDKIYDKVYCLISNSDFGYDDNEINFYEGHIISIKFAARNAKLDWFVTIQIKSSICVNIWSDSFDKKVFFDKEIAKREYKKEQNKNG